MPCLRKCSMHITLVVSVSCWPAAGYTRDVADTLRYDFGSGGYGPRTAMVTPDAGQAAASRTPADRFWLTEPRTKAMFASLGPIDLSFSASRFRSLKADPIERRIEPSRFSVQSTVLQAGTLLGRGLSLQADLGFTLMKYRSVMSSATRPLSTAIATAGIGMGAPEGARLTLQYQSIGPNGRRSALQRMAEQMSGAPAAECGPRLAFSSPASTDLKSRRTSWLFSLAAFRLPLSDQAFGLTSRTIPDNRAELAMKMPF